MADWSELAKDALELITSNLELPDYHRFGAVCKNWHSAANAKHYPPAKQLPWLLLGEDKKTKKRAFFSLSDNKHYYMDIPELYGHVCCGSSFGWLFTVDREFHGHLLNPLTRECFKLPPLPDYHERLTLEDIKPLQGKERDLMQCSLVSKAILSDNPSESSDFTVVILFGSTPTVAFWRPGDPNWSVVKGPYGKIAEVTYFKGKLYALAACFALIVVDLGPHPKMTQIRPLIVGGQMFKEGYLVDFAGKSLILIHRIRADDDDGDTDWDELDDEERRIRIEEYAYGENVDRHLPTKELLAFELDLERDAYCEMDDIDGSAIFVGCGGSLVVVDPSQVGGGVPNRISFSGDGFDRAGFYDMVCETIGEYSPSKHLIRDGVPPTWFIPNPW